MSDHDLPDLPSDEELGIAGLSEEDFDDDDLSADPPPDAGAAPDDPAGPRPPGGSPPPPGGPPPARRPLRGWRGPLTLLLLLAMVWLALPARTMPPTRAANAPDHLFSSGRAMTELVDIARRPHPPGSPDHARVRRLLIERLRTLGLEPEVQTTTYLREAGDEATGATVRNVIARRPGRASTGAIVLTAHYDSRALSPGAGDDGTGVVTILETLRALQTGPELRNDLIVLLTDAEEIGLLGARAFVERHPWMGDVRLVISVEMRGGGGPSIMFETNADNGWIIERLQAADPAPLANSVSMDIYRRMPRDTDFTPFRERGVQGLNFAAIGRAHLYHQAADTPENLDPRTLQHHGDRVLAMVRDLGNQELTDVDAPSRAFATLPFLGLVTYPVAWAPALTGLLAVLLLAVGAVTVLRGGRGRGIAIGAGTALLAIAAAAAVGHLLLVWARGRHPEYGALMGSAFHVEGWYVAALAATALFVATVALAAARRRVHRGAFLFGVLLPGTLLALIAGLVAPEAAINLQPPAAAALVAVLAVALAGPRHDRGWVVWAVALLLALPVLAFLVPVVQLLWVAMSFTLAAFISGAMVLTLLFIAPLLDAFATPNRWWLPATALVAALLFGALGARTATPTAARPAPSTLVYLQDQALPESPTQAHWLTRADAGVEWTREVTASALGREEVLDGLRLGSGSWLIGDAPTVPLPPPHARVVSDSVVGGQRHLVLAIGPGVASEGVGIRVAPPTRIVRLGDADLGAESGGVTAVWSEGLPLNDSTYLVTVVHDPRLATLDLEILQHHHRPWELLGSDHWDRPPERAPNVMNRSDRAVLRARLRLTQGELGAPAPDPLALPADTLALPPDSAAARPDTLRRPPDPTGA